MGYQYRGTVRDVEPPTLTVVTAPKPAPKPVSIGCGDAHGTTAGYKRHQKANEPACEPCKTAVAKYAQEYRAKVRNGERYVRKGFHPDRCGTYAGYVHHLRHQVPSCAPCRKAQCEYMAEYRVKRKAVA